MLPDFAKLALNTMKIIFNFAQPALSVIRVGRRRRGRACLKNGMELFVIIDIVFMLLLDLRDIVGRVARHKRYWRRVCFLRRRIQIFMSLLEHNAIFENVQVVKVVVSDRRCILYMELMVLEVIQLASCVHFQSRQRFRERDSRWLRARRGHGRGDQDVVAHQPCRGERVVAKIARGVQEDTPGRYSVGLEGHTTSKVPLTTGLEINLCTFVVKWIYAVLCLFKQVQMQGTLPQTGGVKPKNKNNFLLFWGRRHFEGVCVPTRASCASTSSTPLRRAPGDQN